MIEHIEQRLTTLKSNGQLVFKQVDEALDLASAMKGKLNRSPVAYVFEARRQPGQNHREMGAPMQEVTTTVGVLVGMAKRNDPTGAKTKERLQPVLVAARQHLFGFKPTAEHSELLLGQSNFVGINEHAVWHLERFTTSHFETALEI